jgi:hypothetical protein
MATHPHDGNGLQGDGGWHKRCAQTIARGINEREMPAGYWWCEGAVEASGDGGRQSGASMVVCVTEGREEIRHQNTAENLRDFDPFSRRFSAVF